MPGGKSKTVVYPFDEAITYTNEGENISDEESNGQMKNKNTINMDREIGFQE